MPRTATISAASTRDRESGPRRSGAHRLKLFGLCRRTCLLPLALLLCISQTLWAAERAAVHYAGFAYLGDYTLLDSNYPLTRSLDHDRSLSELLREELRLRPTRQLDLRYELGNLHQGQTTAIAVALERERVTREVHEFVDGTRTTLKIDIAVQVLVYDVEQGTLLDSFQVTRALNDVMSGDIHNVMELAGEHVRTLYFGSDTESGLIAQTADRIAQHVLKNQHGLRFQVRNVGFLDSVTDTLPSDYSLHQLQQHLGQAYTARLAERAGVTVIPYTRGHAFGNQLPGRFADGSVFSLKLPEPDFVFDLEVRSLIQKPDADNLLYGAQLRFTLMEPLTGTTRIHGDFKKGIWKYALEGRLQTDWSAYEDTLEALLEDLVEQLRKPTRAWHKDHSRDPDQTYRQFSTKGLLHAPG